MRSNITDPVTAITRFETLQYRDVCPSKINVTSYIQGKPGVRNRLWSLEGNRIGSCYCYDTKDHKENIKKINKFIKQWNTHIGSK